MLWHTPPTFPPPSLPHSPLPPFLLSPSVPPSSLSHFLSYCPVPFPSLLPLSFLLSLSYVYYTIMSRLPLLDESRVGREGWREGRREGWGEGRREGGRGGGREGGGETGTSSLTPLLDDTSTATDIRGNCFLSWCQRLPSNRLQTPVLCTSMTLSSNSSCNCGSLAPMLRHSVAMETSYWLRVC